MYWLHQLNRLLYTILCGSHRGRARSHVAIALFFHVLFCNLYLVHSIFVKTSMHLYHMYMVFYRKWLMTNVFVSNNLTESRPNGHLMLCVVGQSRISNWLSQKSDDLINSSPNWFPSARPMLTHFRSPHDVWLRPSFLTVLNTSVDGTVPTRHPPQWTSSISPFVHLGNGVNDTRTTLNTWPYFTNLFDMKVSMTPVHCFHSLFRLLCSVTF